MIDNKDLIEKVSTLIDIEELAVTLIKREFEVEQVSITNEPIEVNRYGSKWVEFARSRYSEVETTIVLKDGTKITIDKEVLNK